MWDPERQEVIGGYRLYFPPKGCTSCDVSKLASSSYFSFSEKFLKRYYPHMMELGRSFVHPDYQSRAMGRKSLFALDNLWDGQWGLMRIYPAESTNLAVGLPMPSGQAGEI